MRALAVTLLPPASGRQCSLVCTTALRALACAIVLAPIPLFPWCRKEYEEQYLPDLERRKAERQELERRRQAAELERLAADRAAPAGAAGGSGTGGSGSTAGEGSAAGRRVLDGRKGATLRTLQEEEDEEALRRLD